MAEVWAIILAAGGGARFGDRKQFAELGGRTVVHRSIETARAAGCRIVAVVPADVAGTPRRDADRTVAGGATRSQSVRAGLAAVPDSAEVIVVHDAARPLATVDLWRRVIDALQEDGIEAAVPVVALVDSLRHAGGWHEDRDDYVAVQTPQAFTAGELWDLHSYEPEHTDDSALFDPAFVAHLPGEASNIKITHPWDLEVAAAIRRVR